MAWQFSPKASIRSKAGAACPAIRTTLTAATSKPQSTASWSVACIPNGNPQPGSKFDYKLAWFERLIKHARELYASGQPVVLAGDYNVVPTDFDIYNPKSWRKDALLQPETREAYQRLLSQGWVDALRKCHPDAPIYTFWDYFRNHWERNSGLRIDHLLLNKELAKHLVDANVDRWVRGQPKASDHAPVWVEVDV